MILNNGLNYYARLLQYTVGGLTYSAVDEDGNAVTASIGPNSTGDVDRGQIFGRYFWSGYFEHIPSLAYVSNNSNLFYESSSSSSSYARYCGVIFGDGDTPPALTDYSLSGNQITDFNATVALNTAVSDGKITGTAAYTITNTGASAFTIKEIAVSIMGASSHRVIIIRDLLDTPVTIEPGQTGVVVYKLSWGN